MLVSASGLGCAYVFSLETSIKSPSDTCVFATDSSVSAANGPDGDSLSAPETSSSAPDSSGGAEDACSDGTEDTSSPGARKSTATSMRAMTARHATTAATFRYVYPAFLILSGFILLPPFLPRGHLRANGAGGQKHRSCPPRRSAVLPRDYCSASFLSLLYFSFACTSASPNSTLALSGNAICSAEYLVSLRMKS